MLVQSKVRIEGVCPMLMHNGQTADPTNKFTRQMKEISGKKKKTDEDYAELSRIEWHAGLYVNKDGKLIIPAFMFEACVYNGAKKSKLGKAFKSAVFVEDDSILDIGVKYEKATDLWINEQYRDIRGVRIGQVKVMRTRPIFHNWSAEFLVSFDDQQVNESDVARAIDDAGVMCGLGDFIPRYGRFKVVEG